MYRIDNSTAALSLPTPAGVGSRPNGFFTGGNPATSTPATIVDADWLNALQEELAYAITASGQTLSKTNRQQLAAALVGRLLNIQIITATATYNPTSGTNKIRLWLAGGAGAGGGPLATGSGQYSVGGGGQAGGFAMSLITSGFAGLLVTIGGGGAGVLGGVGGTGGASSFGGLVSCPGGTGGQVAAAAAAVTASGGQGGGTPVGGNLMNIKGQFGAAGSGSYAGSFGFGGAGGNSIFGFGALWGGAPSGYGAGGSGLINGSSSSAQIGISGTGGLALIEEYA